MFDAYQSAQKHLDIHNAIAKSRLRRIPRSVRITVLDDSIVLYLKSRLLPRVITYLKQLS